MSNSMSKLMLNILLSFAQFKMEITPDRIRDKIVTQNKKILQTRGYTIWL